MNNVPLWVTLMGFAAPLIALAGSAVAYVVKLYQDAAIRRRSQFFELMQFIDGKSSVATKVAAVYRLRDYPEHRDFIIRFCQIAPTVTSGEAIEALISEYNATKNFFEKQGRSSPQSN